MKTQTFIKLAFAVLLILQVEQLNFQSRTQTINFERCAQSSSAVTKVNDFIEVATGAKQVPYPQSVKYGDGFISVYMSNSKVYGSAYSSIDATVSGSALITPGATETLSNPAIGLLSDGSYLLCYSNKNTPAAQTPAPSETANSETISGSEPDASGSSITYTVPCMPYTSKFAAGSAIANIVSDKTVAAASSQSVYGLSAGGFLTLINDGSNLFASIGTTSKYTQYTLDTGTFDTSAAKAVEFTQSSKATLAIVYGDSTTTIGLIVVAVASMADSLTAVDIATAASGVYKQVGMTYLSNGKLFITYVNYISGKSTYQLQYSICDPTVTTATLASKCTSGDLTNLEDYTDCQFPSPVTLSNNDVMIATSCMSSSLSARIIRVMVGSSDVSGSVDSWQVHSAQTGSISLSYPTTTLLSSNRVMVTYEDLTGYAVYGAVYTANTNSSVNMMVSLVSLALAFLLLVLL